MTTPLLRTEPLHVPLGVAQLALVDRIAEDAYEALGDALGHEPPGRRLLIVRERKRKMRGGLTIPDDYQEQVYAGWVLGTGPYIGTPVAERFPGGWHGPASQLLGCKVVFSRGAFDHLILTDRDRAHDASYGIITDCDLKLIDRTDDALCIAVQKDYDRAPA